MVAMFGTFSVSAPGKILLSGEHAVVYNTTAVAAAVEKRTTLTCSPSQNVRLSIQHQQMTVTHEWKLADLQELVRGHERYFCPTNHRLVRMHQAWVDCPKCRGSEQDQTEAPSGRCHRPVPVGLLAHLLRALWRCDRSVSFACFDNGLSFVGVSIMS